MLDRLPDNDGFSKGSENDGSSKNSGTQPLVSLLQIVRLLSLLVYDAARVKQGHRGEAVVCLFCLLPSVRRKLAS